MGELTEGTWDVPAVMPPRRVPIERRPPSEWDRDGGGGGPKPEPPKADEWPVRKVKEPPKP